MLETDAPWCDIQPIHAGFEFVKTSFPAAPKNKFQMGMCVQRRTEPAHVVQVSISSREKKMTERERE